jgi:putative SOS response-associated peptidase YedK
MCNLYSHTMPVEGMRKLFAGFDDGGANLPPQTSIFPDYEAPIVRNGDGGPRLAKARWGMPSPAFALKDRKTDPGVTNVRNTTSSHWRRWLGVEHRCLVPFTSFSEFSKTAGGDIWFAFDESRPTAFFAGIWTPQWKSVRKLKEGEVEADLYAFLTTEPNAEVKAIHPKAMPVILTTPEQCATWMTADWPVASYLQRPLPDDSLKIVARGRKKDGPAELLQAD